MQLTAINYIYKREYALTLVVCKRLEEKEDGLGGDSRVDFIFLKYTNYFCGLEQLGKHFLLLTQL